ncbi:raffinose/stachyose/melibiose transport system permease protein [Micromonospora pallida]|uniref:Raffinose/stachyose/melibiose transport system permease protein n=1 Tax=Micromonospora pallida TaxID=145854 RepID=A0A1C6SHJ6_9ACTN|nr:carbohydrate ABC transporter permease [Micromonospora pallida]SCL28913.1 raffinose/stachyose/melibiose transport system permease protein [Micromonospora pallida]
MNRYTWRSASLESVMFMVALLFLFPIYILINLAIRPADDLSSPVAPTKSPTFLNFVDAWNQASIGGAMANSMIITVVSVALLVLLSSLAAYPLARLTSKWSSLAFYGFMVGLLVPFQLGLIPLYKMMRDIGLLGSILPLIIIYVGLRIPFSLFLYVQFLRQIPLDYEEAAAIDGCSPARAFFRVVFPLLRPVTGTVVILNGLFIWNDFLKPLLYLSGTSNQTLPVAIYTFVGEYESQWELIFAALILGALPVLIAFFFLQKSLIQGFSSGVKG